MELIGLTVFPFRRVCCRRMDEGTPWRKVKVLLALLLVVTLMAGCGGYSSQASKYLTQARSEVLGSAYTLERFDEGQVSTPFLQASLEQYAKAMESTARNIGSLKPPRGARKEHQQQVEAISRAHTLVQKAGQEGVEPKEAPELARRLKRFGKELKSR